MKSIKTGLIEIEESESSEFFFLSKIIKSAGREKLRSKLGMMSDSYFEALKKTGDKINDINDIKERIGELFKTYFMPYQNLITVRSSKTKDNLLQDAMSYYTDKEYSSAAELFKRYLIKYPENQLILLYLGISLLATGKYKNASPVFKKILKIKNSLLTEEVKWYLALTYLKEFKIEESLTLLKKIGKESIYFRKASNLRKKITLLK